MGTDTDGDRIADGLGGGDDGGDARLQKPLHLKLGGAAVEERQLQTGLQPQEPREGVRRDGRRSRLSVLGEQRKTAGVLAEVEHGHSPRVAGEQLFDLLPGDVLSGEHLADACCLVEG